MKGETPLVVTDQSFDREILKADKPALVDFWAPWCGPCRMLAPTIEQIAQEYGDRIIVSKLNVDENPVTTSKYGIRSIPTLILFKDGAPVDGVIGVVPKDKIEAMIKKVL
ncbi:MAG: thioredoxin [Syntrophales bacterium]|nr:thioredoxin [Syntrophales bacterium]